MSGGFTFVGRKRYFEHEGSEICREELFVKLSDGLAALLAFMKSLVGPAEPTTGLPRTGSPPPPESDSQVQKLSLGLNLVSLNLLFKRPGSCQRYPIPQTRMPMLQLQPSPHSPTALSSTTRAQNFASRPPEYGTRL